MGEGKHCRFAVCSANPIAQPAWPSADLADWQERADVIAELGTNHWNGSIEQLRVRFPAPRPPNRSQV